MQAGRWKAEEARTPEQVEAVIALFEALAAVEGWQPGAELRAHRERSDYFALTEKGTTEGEGRLIGGLQLVTPDACGGLPCHQVWPELPPVVPCSGVAHAAVLAVVADRRGRGPHTVVGEEGRDADSSAPFWLLCLALWQHCIERGTRELWLEATPKMLRAYRLLGLPLLVQGPMRVHWGEECWPCKLFVRDVAGAITERALTSGVYRSLLVQAVTPQLPGLAEAA